MGSLTFETFSRDHQQQIEALYRSSGAAGWSVSLEDFARAAWQGIASAAQAEPSETLRLLAALRIEDLALALGCARGDAAAWDTFCAQYRSVLYDAAYAIVHEESRARELAESLPADLFVSASGSTRPPRFAYFHGRSSLKTWLRALLYQKFVNEYRRESRLEPLPEDPGELPAFERSSSERDDRHYAECLSEAAQAALGELVPREKLLLSYYYVEQLTLQQIGRLIGEHEATISRHLESLRKKLRKRIEGYLRRVRKLSAFEVERCLDFATRGLTIDLEKALRQD